MVGLIHAGVRVIPRPRHILTSFRVTLCFSKMVGAHVAAPSTGGWFISNTQSHPRPPSPLRARRKGWRESGPAWKAFQGEPGERVEVDDDPRQPTPTTSHPTPHPVSFRDVYRGVEGKNRHGTRANDVLSLFPEEKSEMERAERKKREYKPRFHSFFLTYSIVLRFFVSIDTKLVGGRWLHQVMMYRGKFPAENYPRSWPRSHGRKVIIFFFLTRSQTYV